LWQRAVLRASVASGRPDARIASQHRPSRQLAGSVKEIGTAFASENPVLQSWASLITTQRLSGTAVGCGGVGGGGLKGPEASWRVRWVLKSSEKKFSQGA